MSDKIPFGTEAVEANASVAAETAPLAAVEALVPAFEATEAVASALWAAAEEA